MSMTNQFANPLAGGINTIRRYWSWFLVLGILLIVFGAICVVSNVTATFATVLVFGWLLLFSGIVSLVQSFRMHPWSGSFLHLLSALLRGFTGYLFIRYPAAGAFSLTLILASFFIVGGLFRAIGAGRLQFPRWGWSVFSGVVSVVLGITLLAQMPLSSLWFIGFAIGLDMTLEGISIIGFAAALRVVPDVLAFDKAA